MFSLFPLVFPFVFYSASACHSGTRHEHSPLNYMLMNEFPIFLPYTTFEIDCSLGPFIYISSTGPPSDHPRVEENHQAKCFQSEQCSSGDDDSTSIDQNCPSIEKKKHLNNEYLMRLSEALDRLVTVLQAHGLNVKRTSGVSKFPVIAAFQLLMEYCHEKGVSEFAWLRDLTPPVELSYSKTPYIRGERLIGIFKEHVNMAYLDNVRFIDLLCSAFTVLQEKYTK